MKKVSVFLVILTLAGALSLSLYAEQEKAGIAGKWDLTVDGMAMGHTFPHVDLELEQNGKKVTGNFMVPEHGDLPMEGEFNDGKLTMHSTEDGYIPMDLNAQLKEDGTLAGTVKAVIFGEMTWTGKRVTIN